MPITEQEILELKERARKIREQIVEVTGQCGGSHIGGSLSMVEILTLMYWKYLNHEAAKPDWKERDRLVVSKGHAGIGHAVVLGQAGYIESKELDNFNVTDSMLGMHLDSKKVPGVEVSTGSMGHGLGQAVGQALGARTLKKDWRVYCVIGDGESDEGSIWEAAMSAAHYKLANLICFLDRNHMMIDGMTEDVMRLEPLADKWRAFGWNVIEVDGHDLTQLSEAIDAGQACTDAPTMIVCDTKKGKGVPFMEDNPAWHYGSLNSEMTQKALEAVRGGK